MAIMDLLKSSHRGLDQVQALIAPVDALLGVSEPAAQALERLAIRSVFDLACSSVFATARAVLDSLEGDSIPARVGRLPGDVFDVVTPVVPQLETAGLGTLRAIDAPTAIALEAALGVDTVRDLALWPPYVAARVILDAVTGREADQEPADELVPRLGEFPTERSYYTCLVRRPSPGAAAGSPLTSIALDHVGAGATAPTLGALVTFCQSWFAQGVTLGNLLHSVALAPGESTRIAMVDWTSAVRASATGTSTESEALTAELVRSRAIGETVSSTANELQSGSSKSGSKARSGSVGGSIGLGIGPLSIGGSGSYSTQSSEAWTTTASEGSRALASSMTQNLVDATNQSASSVRNRRASMVKEISQEEHEQVSTRIVANYNHMHALTVQYFEVVQVNAVQTGVQQVEGALFVPFDVLDFAAQGQAYVDRYRGVLAANALTQRAWEMLTVDWGSVRVMRGPAGVLWTDDQPVLPAAALLHGLSVESRPAKGVATTVATGPVTVTLNNGSNVVVTLEGATGLKTELATAVKVSEVDRVTIASAGPATTVDLVLNCSYFGTEVQFRVPAVELADAGVSAVVARFGDIEGQEELLAHLQSHRRHYSTAVLGALTSSDVVVAIGDATWEGTPVLDLIDPTPVGVVGNQVAFRVPGLRLEPGTAAEAEDQPHAGWAAWAHDAGLISAEPVSHLVPLPSGGVFAEAVLGRSNAAEKLDLTRFWNWQDSPIPLAPPEIASIAMGGRGRDVSVDLPEGATPTLSVQAPPAAPDPTGLVATIQAMAAGSMFRDMSAATATADLAKRAAELAVQQSTSTQTQAGANLKAASDKQVELEKVDAQKEANRLEVLKKGMDLAATKGIASQNPSVQGAILNAAAQTGQGEGTARIPAPAAQTVGAALGASVVGAAGPAAAAAGVAAAAAAAAGTRAAGGMTEQAVGALVHGSSVGRASEQVAQAVGAGGQVAQGDGSSEVTVPVQGSDIITEFTQRYFTLPQNYPFPMGHATTGKSRLGLALGEDLKPLDKAGAGASQWEISWNVSSEERLSPKRMRGYGIQSRAIRLVMHHWPAGLPAPGWLLFPPDTSRLAVRVMNVADPQPEEFILGQVVLGAGAPERFDTVPLEADGVMALDKYMFWPQAAVDPTTVAPIAGPMMIDEVRVFRRTGKTTFKQTTHVFKNDGTWWPWAMPALPNDGL